MAFRTETEITICSRPDMSIPSIFCLSAKEKGCYLQENMRFITRGGHPYVASTSNRGALREINAFEWEGDFKPMARKALKELLEKGMEEEMAEFVGFRQHACNLRVKGDGLH